jgi:hypothetical protein
MIVCLILLSILVGVHSSYLNYAVLRAYREIPITNRDQLYDYLLLEDFTISREEFEVQMNILEKLFSVPQWFYEVLVADSIVRSPREETLEVLKHRALENSFQVPAEMLEDMYSTWKLYCLDRGYCTVDENQNRVLTRKGEFRVIDYFFRKQRISEDFRRFKVPIHRVLRRNPFLTIPDVQLRFGVTDRDAQRIYLMLMGIFEQPKWFLEFLRNHPDAPHNLIGNEKIYKELLARNRNNALRTRGCVRLSVRAWTLMVIESGNNDAYVEDRKRGTVCMKTDIIARYFRHY